MTENPGIANVADLLAHALAMESEAHDRYLDLAEQLEVHHNTEVAALFRKMAKIEQLHVQKILERVGGLELPRLSPWEYRWLDAEAPEAAAIGEAHYMMTPHHALSMALRAEQRALEFYTRVLAGGGEASMQALARELAEEERGHVELVKAWLAKYPKPAADWAEDPDPPLHQE
ncbi:MAG TPA: ferritin family protein [Kiloniellales bacterium]